MSSRMFEWAAAMFADATKELDAKIALCREMGYPMPEGGSRCTDAEIDLLALAKDVLYGPDEQARATAREKLAGAIAESGHGPGR